MKIVLNLDTRQVVSDFGNNNPIGIINATSQDTLSLEVYMVRGGVVQNMGAMSILFGLVKAGDLTDTLLASVSSFTQTLDAALTASSGVNTYYYQALIDFDTVPMRAAMAALTGGATTLTCNAAFRYATTIGEIIHTDPPFQFALTLPVIQELSIDAVGVGGFTVPAIAANVTIPLAGTTSWLMPLIGLNISIVGAGVYQVVSITDGTHFIAKNTGAAGNAVAGTVIAAGAVVGDVPIATLTSYPTGAPGTNGVGVTWRGAWSSATAYIVNDAVFVGGSSYVCILAHTNHTPPNATYWSVLAAAGTAGTNGTNGTNGSAGAPIVWRGAWNSATAYAALDAISLGGNSYICILANTNQTPPNATYWSLMAAAGTNGLPGINWTGAWSGATAYALNDAVGLSGSSYICILAHTNHTPPNATYWGLLATSSGGDMLKSTYDTATRGYVDRAVLADSASLVTLAHVSGAGTAAAKDVPASGNASSGQCVLGNDTRLVGVGKPFKVWQAAMEFSPPATLYPTFGVQNARAHLAFNDATIWSVFFDTVLPQGIVLTSGLIIRLKFKSLAASSGSAVWGVSLERLNTAESADSFDTEATGTTAITAASTLVETAITLTTIDSAVAGDAIRLKVRRLTSGNSLTGDACLRLVSIEGAA